MDKLTSVIEAMTPGGAYTVHIGESVLRDALGGALAAKAGTTAVVISRRVEDLHGEYVRDSLSPAGRVEYLVYDDSEENKSYAAAGTMLEEFTARGMDRTSRVVAVGGGVTGDFAGFCASVFMRGIPLYHVPTTLLSMVDSSIGGKVAVNLSRGKNMAGAFHRPSLVVSDMRFLSTLPEDELRNGLCEALKHGLIGDRGTLELFDILAAGPELPPGAPLTGRVDLARIVALSAAFKARVVAADERESGLRAILNFGHTAAHAAESLAGYRGLPHGRAVAFGMAVAARLSALLGLISDADAARVRFLVDRLGLMKGMPRFDPGDLLRHMRFDKKNVGGAVRFVLLDGIGSPVIGREVDDGKVLAALEETLASCGGERC